MVSVAVRKFEPRNGAKYALLEIIALAVLATGYSLVPDSASLDLTNNVNFYGAGAFLLIMMSGALMGARTLRGVIVTASFWFRISSGVYFGFGNLISFLANDETLVRASAFYDVQPGELLKFNFIVSVSALVVISTMTLLQQVAPTTTQMRSGAKLDTRGIAPVAFCVAAIGFAGNYGLIVPYLLGAYPGLQLPGFVLTIGLLPPIAIFLLTIWALHGKPLLLLLPVGLLLAECFSSLIMATKSPAVMAVLMFGLAILLDRTTVSRAFLIAVLCTVVFGITGPMVDHTRAAMRDKYGSNDTGTVNERIAIIQDYLVAPPTTDLIGVEGALTRLSYANQAGFAIAEFDQGRPGDSYTLWLVSLVPRLLWSDKPITTDVGVEFNKRATGNSTSSSSPGLFAEAYWGFGWWGVCLIMISLGIVLDCLGRYGMWVLTSGHWWFFPIALLSMRVGIRTDGYFTIDVIGPVATIIVLHSIMYFGSFLFPWLRKSPAARRERIDYLE